MKFYIFLLSLGLIFLSGALISCAKKDEVTKKENPNQQVAQTVETPQTDYVKELGKKFVDLLINKNYKEAADTFDTTMKNALPEEKLKETWEGLLAQVGAVKKQEGVRSEKSGVYDIVFVTCEFEKTKLDVKVVYNDKKEVAGLFFVESKPSVTYKLPSYAKEDSYTEKEVTVGQGEWSLPGTLTVPKDKGPFPALILVHGSGPNDRDETIGPNKPFKDIAAGLASHGIAVLRYEKRTKEYNTKIAGIKNLTVKEESVDDAIEAVKLLQNTKEIDKNKIFVLGHSLGGMLIPRIGLADSEIKGLIIMAGPTRHLEDLMLEQVDYINSLQGENITAESKAAMESLREGVKKIKDLNSSEKSSDIILGAPPSYWLDLRDYEPVLEAKKLSQPIFIIQGERDYQVTMIDYKGWEDSLKEQKNVTFKTYPALNHLFIEGKGKSTPNEYENEGHVSEEAVTDIANWIKSIK